METILYVVVGYIVHIAVLFWLISKATNADRQIKALERQTRLLMQIAKANGVSDDEIAATDF